MFPLIPAQTVSEMRSDAAKKIAREPTVWSDRADRACYNSRPSLGLPSWARAGSHEPTVEGRGVVEVDPLDRLPSPTRTVADDRRQFAGEAPATQLVVSDDPATPASYHSPDALSSCTAS